MTPEIASVVCMGILAGIVAMLKFIPRKNNPGASKHLLENILLIAKTMEYMEKSLDEIKADIKKLLLNRR